MLIHNLTKLALFGAAWVMYVLVALSFVSLAIMLDRFLFFRKGKGDVDKLAANLVRKLRDGDRRGAEDVLAKSSMLEAKIVRPALDWIDGGPDAVSEVLDASMTRERKEFERGLTFLGTLGNNAPFVGLLGTVIGVMITFAAIALSGDVNVNAIAPGVAAALAATVAGLAVAIPALFGYNYLLTRIKNIGADMNVFVDEFVTRTSENYGANALPHAARAH